jgi:hypothetical protein
MTLEILNNIKLFSILLLSEITPSLFCQIFIVLIFSYLVIICMHIQVDGKYNQLIEFYNFTLLTLFC